MKLFILVLIINGQSVLIEEYRGRARCWEAFYEWRQQMRDKLGREVPYVRGGCYEAGKR